MRGARLTSADKFESRQMCFLACSVLVRSSTVEDRVRALALNLPNLKIIRHWSIKRTDQCLGQIFRIPPSPNGMVAQQSERLRNRCRNVGTQTHGSIPLTGTKSFFCPSDQSKRFLTNNSPTAYAPAVHTQSVQQHQIHKTQICNIIKCYHTKKLREKCKTTFQSFKMVL
jgi:hypothetical protein